MGKVFLIKNVFGRYFAGTHPEQDKWDKWTERKSAAHWYVFYETAKLHNMYLKGQIVKIDTASIDIEAESFNA